MPAFFTSPRIAGFAAALLAASLMAACSAVSTESASEDATSNPVSGSDQAPSAAAETASAETGLFDSSTLHVIAISFDSGDYAAMIDAYLASEEKDWIEATVTIDGETYERVGIRLKGNSSLRGLDSGGGGGPSGSLSSDEPESLPWLVDLNQFIDGQEHEGVVEFVVRSNGSVTALNEAVALELLELAGLASQDAAAIALSVNGSEEVLRLVIENPDDRWLADTLDASGALYKAESSGDYSYRGDDPEAYDEVFDQEAGEENTDLTPLIDFLEFINNSDDTTFASEIADRLDVEAFATYLAMQELVDNFDDIDGPGNNSYLYYDTATGQFTVVPWDYNLAFGAGPGGGAGGRLGDDGPAVLPPGGGG
ncbi:MAG TPA: CotH kinase family protein, partial [Candidatus Binatia bacterium]|nr:CotH kinase family protein [Candidatus Binatia bacterium]